MDIRSAGSSARLTRVFASRKFQRLTAKRTQYNKIAAYELTSFKCFKTVRQGRFARARAQGVLPVRSHARMNNRPGRNVNLCARIKWPPEVLGNTRKGAPRVPPRGYRVLELNELSPYLPSPPPFPRVCEVAQPEGRKR